MAVAGFFAYPDGHRTIKDAVVTAVEVLSDQEIVLKPWEALPNIGFKIDDLIRDNIKSADLLVADITYPNANVLYELGYAIAVGRPVVPTICTAIEKSIERVQRVGLFDTIGWATYHNGAELAEKLAQWNDVSWRSLYGRRPDHAQPLFILDTLVKTDFRNHIFHAVENSHVLRRKYDPAEIPRLTAAQAIAEVSSSAGVIVPILDSEIVDSERHNLRAGFIMGLAHGFGIEPLAIQYENAPVPLDYRDFITNSTFRRETESHVQTYCENTLIWNQRAAAPQTYKPQNLLSDIDLGSTAAENESQQLSFYFIETAEFARALRAEGAVVIGRKGSGKSAVFQQVAETSGKNRRICIVDLRPASHNLSEMREALLSVVHAGIFEHTIAAFWQYIIYVEVLLKMREVILPRARNDGALQRRIMEIEERFSLTDSVVSGDFTSRLETAVREVIKTLSTVAATDVRSKLTNLIFERPIPNLRDAVLSFADFFDGVHLLIDDLDKGWPPRQVETHDVATVRHLVEVLNRIQRDLTRRKLDFRHLVFLRSDIYERLVEQTSDRGKYNLIKVDWSDPEQLRHLIRQRVFSSTDAASHEAVWRAFNPSMGGSDALGVMIESSLRRPRFLIDLCERALSFAVNRGHTTVSESDVEEGLRQMSLYLVSDFGYELRDVAGTPEDIFYLFIGQSDLLTEQELRELLSPDHLGIGFDETIDLLLWYGFLGVVDASGRPVYIYDRAYDFRRLEAERPQKADEALYAVNPAFLRGLKRD